MIYDSLNREQIVSLGWKMRFCKCLYYRACLMHDSGIRLKLYSADWIWVLVRREAPSAWRETDLLSEPYEVWAILILKFQRELMLLKVSGLTIMLPEVSFMDFFFVFWQIRTTDVCLWVVSPLIDDGLGVFFCSMNQLTDRKTTNFVSLLLWMWLGTILNEFPLLRYSTSVWTALNRGNTPTKTHQIRSGVFLVGRLSCFMKGAFLVEGGCC